MDSYMKVMNVLEPKFNCSGACNPALFYFTRTIATQPQGGCMKTVTNELAGTYVFPGYACIISSIVMAAIFGFQYLLWCDDAPPSDNQVDDKSKEAE